jgi:Fe2+ or Zn2+ uptake regulation protein
VTEASATLAGWESRCKAHSLSITASRRAILMGMLQSGEACDAVNWLPRHSNHAY